MTMRERSWIPPDGLERARPREVRLTRSGQLLVAVSLALWFGALGATAALQQVSDRQAEQQRSFDASAASEDAEVTRLWRTGGEGKAHRVAYRFEVDGRAYTGQARLRSAEWRSLSVGSLVPIRYLPADPNLSQLAGSHGDHLPAFVAYLVGGALALAAGLVLLPLRCQRRLLSEGRAAPGHVTRHKKGHHGTEFTFEFTTLSGKRITGKTSPRAKPPVVGAPITVVYDPDEPKRSAPYPFELVTPREKRSLYKAAAAASARSMSAGPT
jgi:uncharacterized protein DUF3592